mgnify:CR=1 FL=1
MKKFGLLVGLWLATLGLLPVQAAGAPWWVWLYADSGVLAPNPNLVAQGIPPVPMSLVRAVEKYTEFSGDSFVDWHPNRREMLISHRAQGVQIFIGGESGIAPLDECSVVTAPYEVDGDRKSVV